MDKAKLIELAERLADYTPCLHDSQAICNRYAVEAAAALIRDLAAGDHLKDTTPHAG